MRIIAFDSYELPKILDIEDDFSSLNVVIKYEIKSVKAEYVTQYGANSYSWVNKVKSILSIETCFEEIVENEKHFYMESVYTHYENNPQFRKEIDKLLKINCTQDCPRLT